MFLLLVVINRSGSYRVNLCMCKCDRDSDFLTDFTL